MTTKPTVTDLTLLLLLRVNRLLAEADEVRALRDNLIALARDQTHTGPRRTTVESG